VSTSGLPDTSTSFFAVYAAPAQANRPYVVNMDATSKRPSFAQIYGRYDWTSTVSGTVTVVVFEFSGLSGGSYYVSATKLNGGCGGASLGCSSTLDSSLSSPLTFGFYTVGHFNAGPERPQEAGHRLRQLCASAEIYDSSTRVALPAASASGHAASTATITFPASGVLGHRLRASRR
jgi:hypothetical protein